MVRTLLPLRELVVGVVLLVGCGGDDGGSPATPDAAIDAPGGTIDAAIDAPPAAFTLTSTAYTEGTAIPATHTCDGANTSPPLAWVGAPAGTMSFAIVFTDTSNNNLIHSVIYDIPANLAMLPADVDKVYAPPDVPGAHQTASYSAQVRGYNGPCPPVNGGAHTYEMALYALSVATLPGATMATTRPQAKTLIEANDLAVTKLTGTYAR